MVKNHMHRIASPSSWEIERKTHKFITRGHSGAHPLKLSMAINTVLKEMLNFSTNTKETKFMLNNKFVLVNNKPVHDVHHSVGFMDTISIPTLKQNYRVSVDERGKLIFVTIEDSNLRVLRINGKNTEKGGKQTLNLFSGLNVLNDLKCNVGDGVLVDNNSIKKHLPLKEGSFVILTGGKHIGRTGKISKVLSDNNQKKIEIHSGEDTFITLEKFAYVLGENKSEIKIT